MRTRNAGTPKSATPKKTPPSRKSGPSKAAAGKAKQVKINESSPTSITGSDSKPEQPSASTEVTPEAKVGSGARQVAKRTSGRTKTPASSKSTSKQSPKLGEALNAEVEESLKNEDVVQKKDSELAKEEECASKDAGKSMEKEEMAMEAKETLVEDMVASINEEAVREEATAAKNDEESTKEKTVMEEEVITTRNIEESEKLGKAVENREKEHVDDHEITVSSKKEECDSSNKAEEMKEDLKEEEMKNVENNKEFKAEALNVEGNGKDELQVEYTRHEQDEYGADEGLEDYGDRLDFEDPEEEELQEDDVEEPTEETQTLEEECKELSAVAKERRIKKEHEIFVGGLDRDASEEDVRKVFEKIGEVVEVRLHVNLSTNKNKGYAFVKFANKEHVKRALSEMKNPVICGKRCGTAPSEDNDTLFLGNISNTWTKEAIRQKLKDYGVEGVENITLVPDVQHEGLSRGFAFLEFSCHADAMLAYKRLQKPDVVFGHPERTAKVAFAEPLREPDPEIMAKVRTVFLDGLPPHWDEECLREHLKGYGEIIRIVLARNMSTAKRKDFGFVDFSTHEAAVSCISGVNSRDFGDGNLKTKVKARLSNPLPKTQAVKGGICGGFLIGRGGTRNFSRFGRGFGRGGPQFNWPNFQRNRVFNRHGQGQTSRTGPSEYDIHNRYAEFHGRQTMGRGGRRGPLRGGYHAFVGSVAAAGPSRSNVNRPWHDGPDRGHVEYTFPRRQPFPEEAFDRPFGGKRYDDPYMYDEGAYGMKRPFYMTHHDTDDMEPSRVRPRLDYTDQAVAFRGTRYHDAYRAGGDIYSNDRYDSDYGAYPTYYGGDRSYRGGGGYYY